MYHFLPSVLTSVTDSQKNLPFIVLTIWLFMLCYHDTDGFLFFPSVLVRVFIAVKTLATHIKKPFNWGWLPYSFRGSILYHHDRKHDGMQTDKVLELRMLHLVGNKKMTETVAVT